MPRPCLLTNSMSSADDCVLHCSRSRGQDTLSKMAAFRAGEYQLRAGTRGPSTNVPISRFLVNNGYIPESASRSAIQDDEDSKSDDVTSSTPDFIGVSSGFSFNSAPTALMTNMDEPGSYSSHLVSPDIVNRGMSAPAQSSSGNSDISSAIISGSQQRSKSVLNCQSSALGVVFDTQQPIGPETSKKISSGQNMLASVEEDDHSSEVVALRFEVAQLHNMFQDVIRPHGFRNDDVDAQPQHVPLDMVDSRIKVASLEKRLAQVEGIMHAMHYASFPDISGRLDKLEEALEDLKCKAGDNCVAEVGMMKEVFRGLKESLVRVDHF